MGDVLEKQLGQVNSHVVEEDQMLRDLTHVTYVRHNCLAVLFGEEGDDNALVDAARSRRVHLNVVREGQGVK